MYASYIHASGSRVKGQRYMHHTCMYQDQGSWIHASWIHVSWIHASWIHASWIHVSWIHASWIHTSWIHALSVIFVK